jgi:hypothetical protein
VPEDLFRPQLGEPHHSAYVVEDIETTVSRLVDQFGAGPFFQIENVPLENVLSRGEPAEFVHNSAFGSCGGGAIELIEPVRLAPGASRNASALPAKNPARRLRRAVGGGRRFPTFARRARSVAVSEHLPASIFVLGGPCPQTPTPPGPPGVGRRSDRCAGRPR